MEIVIAVFFVVMAVITWFAAPFMVWFLLQLYSFVPGVGPESEGQKRFWIICFRPMGCGLAAFAVIDAVVPAF